MRQALGGCALAQVPSFAYGAPLLGDWSSTALAAQEEPTKSIEPTEDGATPVDRAALVAELAELAETMLAAIETKTPSSHFVRRLREDGEPIEFLFLGCWLRDGRP